MNRNATAALVAGVLLAGLAAPGCGNKAKGPDIVCTTGMVADVVRNVAGEHFTVGQLMAADVDPHLYESTPGDARQLDGAKLIFYSGLHLEGKMTELFENMARKKPTRALAKGVDEDRLLGWDRGGHDPHIWFDVSLWSQTVDVVRDALVEYDPGHADEYRANAKAYRAKLAKLHEYAKAELAKVPERQRVLVTAHDAFRYFGRAYGVEVRGIQGISTEDEPVLKEINKLRDFIVDRKIKAIFVETSVSDKNVRALVEGCRSKGHTVAIGGELFSDAMGKEGTPEGTYEGMVRHNVDTIVKALK
jgi:manganese/zinc/iron transport system substrate-binding protein